ncbi:biotin transporter BioY [Candidatus Arthromitus sp. SFB-rat-Yit]|uniref:biotin transporter BioY n=1 Tax=Candidatus Arthromitus sp. SFB-rat-Yit TaxID=1041504 RepID=UPI000227A499|nr:biotin transporter BioY [Candidatus Arthromitus sp. SFB-rat-Yit]BAK81565.1 BioY family protein [Candidatus Arthromitus sp. SFB-rat-Yit]
MTIKKMILIAMMTCLIAVCSWINIPSAVPFTMQTFAIFCALLLLGGRCGLLAISLYIFMGCVGLPVFSGFRGGIGHILGPTGGYIVGFVFTAFFYCLFGRLILKYPKIKVGVLIIGLIICYVIGTLWFGIIYEASGTKYSIIKILSMCVFPYIIPDLLKLGLAIFVCRKIDKLI